VMNRQQLLEFQKKYEILFTVMNYCVFMLLGVFIFCTPFPYTTAITNISFYLAIVMALFLMIINPGAFTFKTPFTYPLILFFLWSLLSIFWALNVENTINDVRGHLLNYIILYFLLINFFHSRKRLDALAWIIVLSAALLSVTGMVYYYIILGNPIESYRFGLGKDANVFTDLHNNLVGTLNVTAILFCLYFFPRSSSRNRRIVIILCALASVVAVILTQSRGTLAAFIIAGGTLLLIRKKKLLPVFLIAIIILFFLTPFKNRLDTFTLKERYKINYLACEILKDYPLTGIGFGELTFRDNINKEAYVNKLPERDRPYQIMGPHNWLLDIAVRVGLIGLILFSATLFVFVKTCWKTIRHAKDEGIRNRGVYVAIAFLAYFVMGLVEPLFTFTAPAMMFYIFLGMITILSSLNHEARAITGLPADKE
jgi:O-antigen ligase